MIIMKFARLRIMLILLTLLPLSALIPSASARCAPNSGTWGTITASTSTLTTIGQSTTISGTVSIEAGCSLPIEAWGGWTAPNTVTPCLNPSISPFSCATDIPNTVTANDVATTISPQTITYTANAYAANILEITYNGINWFENTGTSNTINGVWTIGFIGYSGTEAGFSNTITVALTSVNAYCGLTGTATFTSSTPGSTSNVVPSGCNVANIKIWGGGGECSFNYGRQGYLPIWRLPSGWQNLSLPL